MKITHKNQYNKENKMKKELLIGAAIFLPLISACTSVKPVAKSWSERLSEYQITPIFPPREDVYVGDVYLVPAIKQSPQQSTDSNSRDVPYGVLVDSLDLNQEITNFYNNRPSFVTEDLENGNPADAKFNIYKTNDLTRLKKVIFPDFLSSRFSDTGLSASIPGKTIAGLIGAKSDNLESATVSIPYALSYSLPARYIHSKVFERCTTDISFQSLIKNNNSELYVVTEVYYATAMTITINQAVSSGAGAEGIVAVPSKKLGKTVNEIKSAVATNNESNSEVAASNLKNTESRSADSESKDTNASGNIETAVISSNDKTKSKIDSMIDNSTLPGFKFWRVQSGLQQIKIEGTFDKAIAIGFRGMKYSVSSVDGCAATPDPVVRILTPFSGTLKKVR